MTKPYRKPLNMEKITITQIGIFLGYFPSTPLNNPINPQDTICQTVHTPIPKSILDKKVVKIARRIAASGPSNNPQIIISDVTGCTLGRKAKTYLPTTASAARRARRVILYVFNMHADQTLFDHPATV